MPVRKEEPSWQLGSSGVCEQGSSPVVPSSVTWEPCPPWALTAGLPADGVHSVAAQCSLRVTIVTDEMLTHSITLRLEDMSPERFLSPLLGLFIQAVAATLATPPDHVVIFNVQRDTDAPGSHILNVSLSVGQPPGPAGGPPFLPSEDLQERLYLNRSLLAAISAQRVLPFDDNICLREPCENYMRCVSVLRFDSSAPFIASSSVLFRPIHPVGGLRCRCPPGFTGDYCETEVDLCYSRPCGPHGRCRSREGGYTCLCREGYTGEPSEGGEGWGGPGEFRLRRRHSRAKSRVTPFSSRGRVQGTLGIHKARLLSQSPVEEGRGEPCFSVCNPPPPPGGVTEVSLLVFVSQL